MVAEQAETELREVFARSFARGAQMTRVPIVGVSKNLPNTKVAAFSVISLIAKSIEDMRRARREDRIQLERGL